VKESLSGKNSEGSENKRFPGAAKIEGPTSKVEKILPARKNTEHEERINRKSI
jgi:hypothetical protein